LGATPAGDPACELESDYCRIEMGDGEERYGIDMS